MRWTKQHGSAKAYKGFKWWTHNCKLAIASSLPYYLLHSFTIPYHTYHTIPYILPEDTQDRLPYFPHPRTSRMPVGQSCCCWPCFLHGAWLTDVYSAFFLFPNTYPRQNNLLLSSVTFAMWSLCRIHRIARGRFGAPCFFSTCTLSPRFTSCFYPTKTSMKRQRKLFEPPVREIPEAGWGGVEGEDKDTHYARNVTAWPAIIWNAPSVSPFTISEYGRRAEIHS